MDAKTIYIKTDRFSEIKKKQFQNYLFDIVPVIFLHYLFGTYPKTLPTMAIVSENQYFICMKCILKRNAQLDSGVLIGHTAVHSVQS